MKAHTRFPVRESMSVFCKQFGILGTNTAICYILSPMSMSVPCLKRISSIELHIVCIKELILVF